MNENQENKEMVNHPKHYQGNKFEAIDIIEDYNLDFCLGNAIKYILRAGKKGDKIEDIQKAIWYLNREIKMENNPREAAITNITSPEERSQALKNVINAMNKNICPVCGKKLENENMQVCKECEKKIFWGATISEYVVKENKVNEAALRCPICGKFKENKEDEVCLECNNKYFQSTAWHTNNYDPGKKGKYLVIYNEFNFFKNEYDKEEKFTVLEYILKECTKENDYGFWNTKAAIRIKRWKEIE